MSDAQYSIQPIELSPIADHRRWDHCNNGLRTLSGFHGGNAHCAAENMSQKSLRHAFRKVFPEWACVLFFFLPAWKFYMISANRKRADVSTIALSLSVGRRDNCIHRCYSLTIDSSLIITTNRNGARESYNSITREMGNDKDR